MGLCTEIQQNYNNTLKTVALIYCKFYRWKSVSIFWCRCAKNSRGFLVLGHAVHEYTRRKAKRPCQVGRCTCRTGFVHRVHWRASEVEVRTCRWSWHKNFPFPSNRPTAAQRHTVLQRAHYSHTTDSNFITTLPDWYSLMKMHTDSLVQPFKIGDVYVVDFFFKN